MNTLTALFLLLVVSLYNAEFVDEKISSLPENLDEVIDKTTKALRVTSLRYLDDAPMVAMHALLISKAQIQLGYGRLNATEETVERLKKFDSVLVDVEKEFTDILEDLDHRDMYLNLMNIPSILEKVERLRLAFVYNEDESLRGDLLNRFDETYQDEALFISDVLYKLLADEFGKRDSLFHHVSSLNHRHPVKTLLFARGILSLAMRAVILEGSHVFKEFNGTDEAMDSFFIKTSRWFTKVAEIARTAYNECIDAMPEQMKEDHRRIIDRAHEVDDNSYCDLSKQLTKYFNDKYRGYSFMSTVYEPLQSSKYHSLSVCQGSKLVNYHGVNSAVSYIPKADLTKDFTASVQKKVEDIPKVEVSKADRAETMAEAIEKAVGKPLCSKAKMLLVIDDEEDSCSSSPPKHALKMKKTAFRCRWPFCWSKKTYKFNVIMFG